MNRRNRIEITIEPQVHGKPDRTSDAAGIITGLVRTLADAKTKLPDMLLKTGPFALHVEGNTIAAVLRSEEDGDEE